MDILTTLQRSGGIDALARELDLVPADAALAIKCLMPGILDGIRRTGEAHGGGLAGLQVIVSALNELGGGQLTVSLLAGQVQSATVGAATLAVLLGGADQAEPLLENCKGIGGLSSEALRNMLPLLAILIAGYICARTASEQGLDWLPEYLDKQAD